MAPENIGRHSDANGRGSVALFAVKGLLPSSFWVLDFIGTTRIDVGGAFTVWTRTCLAPCAAATDTVAVSSRHVLTLQNLND